MLASDSFLEKFNDLPPFQSGLVYEALDGIAKKVVIGNHIMSVHAQASHLAALKKNDDVLFILTNDGPFIIARRSQRNEKPAPMFQENSGETISLHYGKSAIHISALGEVLIQTPNSFISLSPHGSIKIQAENVKPKAKKNIKLTADHCIDLNSPDEVI